MQMSDLSIYDMTWIGTMGSIRGVDMAAHVRVSKDEPRQPQNLSSKYCGLRSECIQRQLYDSGASYLNSRPMRIYLWLWNARAWLMNKVRFRL
jgi:hypothetical protein